MATTSVVFYQGIRKNHQILDHLVQPEVPVFWEPGIVDVNQRNVRGLMEMANISPAQWRAHLIERFGFDPASPTESGLLAMGVPETRVAWAIETATRLAEMHWQEPDGIWAHDDGIAQNMTPAQVYEVLAETGARGTPVIAFQADEGEVAQAISDDNVLRVSSRAGVFIGLSDPVNGYNWSPANVTGPIVFRPARDGTLVIGDEHLLEYCVDDAYEAELAHWAGEPLMLSSRGDMGTLGAPHVRDVRPAPATAGMTP